MYVSMYVCMRIYQPGEREDENEKEEAAAAAWVPFSVRSAREEEQLLPEE